MNMPGGEWRGVVVAGKLREVRYPVESVLETLLSSAMQLTMADRGVVLLMQDDGGLRTVVSQGFDAPSLEDRKAFFSRTVVQEVRATRSGRVVVDAADEGVSVSESVRGLGLRSVLAAPIRAEERILGVLCLDNRLKVGAFNYDDLDRITALCRLAAMAMENAREG
ncbi:MAG: GAF domain-containing protein [Armatimonadetes bacterium]|nr:GAF domain-containing protein [Armatimonadota bacterium]